jgi:hypothetical protein
MPSIRPETQHRLSLHPRAQTMSRLACLSTLHAIHCLADFVTSKKEPLQPKQGPALFQLFSPLSMPCLAIEACRRALIQAVQMQLHKHFTLTWNYPDIVEDKRDGKTTLFCCFDVTAECFRNTRLLVEQHFSILVAGCARFTLPAHDKPSDFDGRCLLPRTAGLCFFFQPYTQLLSPAQARQWLLRRLRPRISAPPHSLH